MSQKLFDSPHPTNTTIGKNNDIVSIGQVGNHEIATRPKPHPRGLQEKPIQPTGEVLSRNDEQKRGQGITLAQTSGGSKKTRGSTIDVNRKFSVRDAS